MKDKIINFKEFKNWINEQDLGNYFNIGLDKEDPDEKYVGTVAQSKVSEKKLLERVETDEDPVTIIREFLEEGATIIAIEPKKITLEVESGTFTIPRFCVSMGKED